MGYKRIFVAFSQYTRLKNHIANGPLMNCPEFFEAFNVKEGDPMRNPVGKVARIW